MEKDYSTITELPGTKVTELQLKRAHQRYIFACDYCFDKIVLEIGCGGGQGLDLLSTRANKLIAGDVSRLNTDICKETYKNHPNIKILDNLDAHKINLKENTIDTVVFFESIYYLKGVDMFFKEVCRILSQNGHLIICTANKNWSDFNPSPFSTKYFSVPELYEKAKSFGFRVSMYGSFPDINTSILSKLVSIIKRTVIALNLMPKTMKGKVLFKRIFLGNMLNYPSKLKEDMFVYENPVPIPVDQIDKNHTAIFAVCQKL